MPRVKNDVWDSKLPTSGWSHCATLCCLEQTCACGSPFGAHGSSSCPAGTAKHGEKLLFKSCQNLHGLVTWNQVWNVSNNCASSLLEEKANTVVHQDALLHWEALLQAGSVKIEAKTGRLTMQNHAELATTKCVRNGYIITWSYTHV